MPTSLNASGTAAAPGAGSAFVSLAGVPPGTYRVSVLYGVSGAAEPQAKNVRLSLAAGGSIADLPSGMGVAAVMPFEIGGVHVSNPAGDTLRLTAIGAATASTVYTGSLSVQRIGP